MTSRNCSGVSLVAGYEVPRPAQLTRMSTRPNSVMAALASASHWPGIVTSVCRVTACPPSARIASATDSSRPVRRAPSTTRAPACASPLAKAGPRPDDAPVTIATRSVSRNSSRIDIAELPFLRSAAGGGAACRRPPAPAFSHHREVLGEPDRRPGQVDEPLLVRQQRPRRGAGSGRQAGRSNALQVIEPEAGDSVEGFRRAADGRQGGGRVRGHRVALLVPADAQRLGVLADQRPVHVPPVSRELLG